MGQFHNEIPENIMEWIPKQHTFWVASAPLSADGHINISPKGVAGTFHVVNSRRVWYEDLSGTGGVYSLRQSWLMLIHLPQVRRPSRTSERMDALPCSSMPSMDLLGLSDCMGKVRQ